MTFIKNNQSPYKLHIKIQGLPKTINAIGRQHHWIKIKEARKWKELVRIEIGDNIPTKPLSQAHIACLRASSSCPDYDGLVSSFKHVIDALISSYVIEDDSMNHIGMPSFRWKKVKPKKGFIEITVTEQKA